MDHIKNQTHIKGVFFNFYVNELPYRWLNGRTVWNSHELVELQFTASLYSKAIRFIWILECSFRAFSLVQRE